MKDTASRIKRIGAVTLFSMTLFIIMVFALSKFSLRPQREVRIYFTFINSLELGAPVRFAGVRVGEVRRIHVLTMQERAEFPPKGQRQPPPYVCVYAGIDRNVSIPKDADAMVNTMGFMGEKYVELKPKPNSESIDYLTEGDYLTGIDPTAMDTVFASAQRLAERMEGTASNMNFIVVEMQDRLPVLIGEFEKTLASAQELAGDARVLTKDVQGMVNTNRENLEHLIANARQMTIYMKSFSHVLATRPWKLVWGFGGPIPVQPEEEKFVPPQRKTSPDDKAPSK
jgi:phospholipid/cholesterol/gamma-HCH transport system substrate-binding protein